ncbi:hypothetical protein SEPCBS57363_003022 [Sporothrix epigloea]|uniref:Uncharacterized protein n=1 Tax=Sporothrix epigloea TaxID=1892477 RepID=A0ABP0DLX0_9PEZI
MSEPTIAHAPSFRGRGRGRGRSQAIRAHVARLAQARKAANGRRGRQKLYDHPKPQAASERLKELKAAYSTVANAIRPALEDLADRSLEVLNKGQADAYRAFKEYEEVKSFLDNRIRDVQSVHNNRLLLDTQLSEFMFRETRKITEESFIRDVEDARERFYDAQLMRLEILDKLHDNELPIDIIDDSWNFHEISDERFRDVKAHVEFRTDLGGRTSYGAKIEVPCAKAVTGRRLARTPTTGNAGSGQVDDEIKPSPKRKADEEADALPIPKRLGAVPRHIGGLLSAVVAPTDEHDDYEAEAAGSPGGESKVPSPTPAEEEDDILEDEENDTPMGDDEDDVTHLRPSERLPPLPNGASEPDAHGVRLINKRRTANFDVYNRILIPALFEFEPHEIGFRDSTNDKSRGATKIKRGRFLGTPNSNTMHFDRSLWQYDATTYEEGELDEELVKKHNLHPKHGLFLRTSTNDEETPKTRASGKNPVIFYTPRGRTFNSSRSIRIARLEDGADIASKRPAVAAALDQFAEQEGVPPAEVLPNEEAYEAFRQEKIKLWLGPRRIVRDETEELEEEELKEDEPLKEMADTERSVREENENSNVTASPHTLGGQARGDDAAMAVVSTENEVQRLAHATAAQAVFRVILDAAASVETDNVESGAAQPLASDNAVPQVSLVSPQALRRAASRPFDPVRDVFMDQLPDDAASNQHRESVSYVPPALEPSTRSSSIPYVDASSLLMMADVALEREYEYPTYQMQQQQLPLPPIPTTGYSPPRGQSSGYEYPPNDTNVYPPPSRGMSMDAPQPYHHQSVTAPPPQQATPPLQPQSLLDPRLFGEVVQQPPALPPPNTAYVPARDARNGRGSSNFYQQQQPPPPPPPPPAGYAHSSLPPAPGPPNDHYNQTQAPPLPSAAYGPLPSRNSSQYYTSPPPPQYYQPSSIMRPYDSRYEPTRGDVESTMLPPPGGNYSRQALPPMVPQQRATGSASPQMYVSTLTYARSGSREYQSQPTSHYHHHHHYEYPGSLENGPSNGEYAESNGSNGSNKFRKLEPAPMIYSTSNEWSACSDRERGLDPRDDFRGRINSSNGHGDGRLLLGGPNGPATDEASSSYTTVPVGPANKEFRTVPYDYEKIKEYVAIEPPPSQGPKTIRGWAHNSLKRGGGGTTTTVSKAMSNTVSAIPPIEAENEWDRNRECDHDYDAT